MSYKYFRETEFKYAIKLLETDPFHAKERFEEYLDKYPNDYYARAYYVILLTRICLIDEAEEEFCRIIQEAYNNNFFNDNSIKKLRGFKYNMLVAELKILGAKEQYQEILKSMAKYTELFDEEHCDFISYYCRSKLGLLPKESAIANPNAYRYNQCVDYHEEVFREHIKKHEADYNKDLDTPNPTIFATDVDLDKIIQEIKKYIPSDKRLYPGFFDDVYYFKYDGCGRVNNKTTNYFKVVCYHNTTNFITMCPASDFYNMPYVDLNYLKEKDVSIKDNRPSQIEKFNRRFKR